MSKNIQLHVKLQDYPLLLVMKWTKGFLRTLNEFQNWQEGITSMFLKILWPKLLLQFSLRLLNHKTSWRNFLKNVHKPLRFTILSQGLLMRHCVFIFAWGWARSKYIFKFQKFNVFWHLDLLQRISQNWGWYSTKLFLGYLLQWLTLIQSCSV